jgi:hypothetical protein
MSRESCIAHTPKQALAIVRQDYYELMGRDACAAALLNIFEYWANAALATDPTVERPWVGARPIREFEQMLLGIATDKQIRKRLILLEERGFIQTVAPTQRGAAKTYQVWVPEIQQALVGQMTQGTVPNCLSDQHVVGQMTDDTITGRSIDRRLVGQLTHTPSVKQPLVLRSNDRALKKNPKEFKPEKEQEGFFAFESKPAAPAEQALTVEVSPIQIGTVSYSQPPETIDLAELWAQNPVMAKSQIRFLAPGHKRQEMVVHGVGHWWTGPGLNDFDEHLIQACRNRKRKFQQSDSVGDAKTYVNNMLRNGDWANFSLRCDEAILLRERAAALPVSRAVEPRATGHSPFELSSAERRESALGLARFKVSQGLMDQAWAISQQFRLTPAELGLVDKQTLAALTLNAA